MQDFKNFAVCNDLKFRVKKIIFVKKIFSSLGFGQPYGLEHLVSGFYSEESVVGGGEKKIISNYLRDLFNKLKELTNYW